MPITRQLEAQLALRYDDYSDYGSSTTPKVGLKFKATPELLFRANWGKGFRAPTLPEICPVGRDVLRAESSIRRPARPQQISGVFAGNPNLQAGEVRAARRSALVWEPNNSFNMALDWYEIRGRTSSRPRASSRSSTRVTRPG